MLVYGLEDSLFLQAIHKIEPLPDQFIHKKEETTQLTVGNACLQTGGFAVSSSNTQN
jgi:hypothetical protein